LFSAFSDERSLARAADALWLGGEGNGARNIWTYLVSPPGDRREKPLPGIRNRSLYNLAASADQEGEGLRRLEELVAAANAGEPPWYQEPLNAEPAYIYGVIRYTRLLDTGRALAILETGRLGSHPLLDLEHTRRRLEGQPLDRNVAGVWQLLGRHPGNGDLFQWAAWYFSYQRRYDELALLIRALERTPSPETPSPGPWLELHRSLALMRDSRLEEAAERLRALSSDPAAGSLWEIPANLGRILESRRLPAAALEHYERAAALAQDRQTVSRLQYRIGLCLRGLGRDEESRRVLERALELNPDNLSARLELHRLDG
jgi:tetratricopeptide (TPR) repeat protein